MTPLFLLLWACAPADPASQGPGGTTPDPTDPGQEPFEPVPMGVDTIEPDALRVRVDAVMATCEGSQATVAIDTLGLADALELDLIDDGVVHQVSMRTADALEGAVWVSFTGTASCDVLDRSTWVVRAYRDGNAADCAVHGSQRGQVLAGTADAILADAGRPSIAGCHDIAE